MSDPILFEGARKLMSVAVGLQRLANGHPPSFLALESAPFLSGWQFCPVNVPGLMGRVTGHPTLGNTSVVTSPLVAIDPLGRWARTRSRWYSLEPLVRSDG